MLGKKILAKDIMVKKVVTIEEHTPLLDAYHQMLKRGFNGLPVVDKNKKVIGIITEYDLITKTTEIHLPTYIKIFGEPLFNKKKFFERAQDGAAITVKSVINRDPLLLGESTPLIDVVKTFAAHHRVNPVPVVDKSGKLVGVISRYDIVKFYAKFLE